MNNIKFLLPPLVSGAVLGVGFYLALLAFHGNHKAMAIAGGVLAIAAAVGFIWTAFKVGPLFRRGLVTSTTVTVLPADATAPPPAAGVEG
jgi:hypothetical protein